jgi:hypothetical protein
MGSDHDHCVATIARAVRFAAGTSSADRDRPVGGYATLLGAYAGLVAIGGLQDGHGLLQRESAR